MWPQTAGSVNFEAELGVVIGRRAKGVALESGLEYVMGYTVSNDATSFAVSKEDGGTGFRFKSFDTFCPMGPWIVTGLDGNNLHLTSRLNGVTKQDVSTNEMSFSVQECEADPRRFRVRLEEHC